MGVSDPGIVPVGGAIVRLRADGSINVSANTVEIGQGSRGVLRIIAHKALGQPLRRIAVAEPDTLQAPYDWGTGRVQEAGEKTGYADFWELYKRNNLPAETKN